MRYSYRSRRERDAFNDDDNPVCFMPRAPIPRATATMTTPELCTSDQRSATARIRRGASRDDLVGTLKDAWTEGAGWRPTPASPRDLSPGAPAGAHVPQGATSAPGARNRRARAVADRAASLEPARCRPGNRDFPARARIETPRSRHDPTPASPRDFPPARRPARTSPEVPRGHRAITPSRNTPEPDAGCAGIPRRLHPG
jgi:hypothetical protein